MLNWENLQYFIAIARQGTLSAAADSLDVSHTTVYRRIRAFETELGTRLFEKVSHRYALTPVGQQLLGRLGGVELELGRVTRELAGLDQRVEGQLIIATTDTLGFTMLPPLIKAFTQTYPQVNVELKASASTLNLAQREADIAVRATSSPPESLIGKRIGKVRFALFCARADAQSRTFDGRCFNGHRVVALGPAWFGAPKRWLDERLQAYDVQRTDSDSFLMAARLCQSGLGIALLPSYMGEHFDGLHCFGTTGELDGDSDFDGDLSTQLWLLFHRDLMASARIRVASNFFWNALKEQFAGQP